MSKLIVYKEEKSLLSEVAFVRDTITQTKIREVDSYEFTKQIGMLLTKINAQMGIKHEISNIYKQDIKEMILSRFKNLSLNEIEFAFRLERYGEYIDEKGHESRTDHFHDFNTVYVSTILGKYVLWKRNMKINHQISAQNQKIELTEEQKQKLINNGIIECIEYYEQHRTMMDGKITFAYDVLYDDGYLPKDDDYKRKMYKDAVLALEIECRNRVPANVDEKKHIKEVLKQIKQPRSSKAITKAKELIVLDYFRKLTANERYLEAFKEKYSN